MPLEIRMAVGLGAMGGKQRGVKEAKGDKMYPVFLSSPFTASI